MDDGGGNVHRAAIAVVVPVLEGHARGVGASDDIVDAIGLKVIVLADDVGEILPYRSLLVLF